jgi:hypothetical protein
MGRIINIVSAFAQSLVLEFWSGHSIRSGTNRPDRPHPSGENPLLFLNALILTSHPMKQKALDILDRLKRSGASKEDRLTQGTMP